MDLYQRAKTYLDRLPPAISGNNGHDSAFTAACTVVRFGLTEDEQWDLMQDFNARCQPPWSEKDLRHKLTDARRKAVHGELASSGRRNGHHATHAPLSGWRPTTPTAPTPPPPSAGPIPAKSDHPVCPQAKPEPLPPPIERGALEILRTLYKPDECVRIVKGIIPEDGGRERPEDAGCTLPVRDWIARAEARKGDLAGLWTSSTGAGVYVGMNPLRQGGSKDEDVSAYRFALIESDDTPQEQQWATIRASRVPVAAVIDSAGKSIHSWIRVDAKNRAEFEERVRFLFAYFPWADKKNGNPARLSRLPDARRKDRRQRLLATNLGCDSWSEWLVEVQRQALGPALSFGDLCTYDTSRDPNCVIGMKGDDTLRYLCRGKSAWLLGPSGVGKSSLEAQLAVGWALGQPVFGITPRGKLRSLIIQAENDAMDLAEMIQGVASAHGLTRDDPRWEDVSRNVLFRTETSSFGARFVHRLREMLEHDRPDIVWIDPLLSFAGIDVSRQDQVTPFLRELLTPVIEAAQVVLIGIHHTGKPKDSKATKDWTPIDWAYAGIGSSELVNWARAVMLLRPVEDRTYELKLAKRGSRAGATNADGSPAKGSVWIRQALGRIYWEHLDPPEEAIPDEEGPAPRRKGGGERSEAPKGPVGRPSIVDEIVGLTAIDEFVGATPPAGETQAEITRRLDVWAAQRRKALSATTSRRAIDRLIECGKLAKNPEGRFIRNPNPQ